MANNLEEWMKRRSTTFSSFCLLAACLGAEYSVIIPSLWFYLTDVIKVDGAKRFYGATLAVYYVSAIIGSFTITWLVDQTRKVRLAMLLLISCEIIGNILYSVPTSPYFPLIGRFIQGLGDVNMSIMTAEVARSYEVSEMSGKISTLVTCFSATFVIAPALNVAFKYIDVNVLGWRVNYGNIPGLFMAVFLSLLLVVVFFRVTDLSREYDLKDMNAKRINSCMSEGHEVTQNESEKIPLLNDSFPCYNNESNETSPCHHNNESNEFFPCYSNESSHNGTSDESVCIISEKWSKNCFQVHLDANISATNEHNTNSVPCPETSHSAAKRNSVSQTHPLCQFDFVFLVALGFLMSFTVVAFLDVATPIYGKQYFNFNSRDTGILFFVTGLLFIVVVNITKKLSSWVTEYCFLVIGFCIFITSTLLLFSVTYIKRSNYYLGVTLFVTYVLLLGVCWCIEQIFIRSILSKIVPSACQALAEGVRRSASSLACIVASLVVPYFITKLSFLCIGVVVLSFASIGVLQLRRNTLKEPRCITI